MLNQCCTYLSFFFFKRKTAYEMRISNWSSDVCTSDLQPAITADVGGAVEVDVHVDQAREQGLVAKVDMFDIRSPAHRARIGDVRDAAIGADEDRGKLDRLAGEHIDVARGGEDRKSTRLNSSH